jgi:hypothetical protein
MRRRLLTIAFTLAALLAPVASAHAEADTYWWPQPPAELTNAKKLELYVSGAFMEHHRTECRFQAPGATWTDWATCEEGYSGLVTFEFPVEGEYHYEMRAVTDEGPDPTPLTHTFRADHTAPTGAGLTRKLPADGTVFGVDKPTFEIQADEPDVTVSCFFRDPASKTDYTVPCIGTGPTYEPKYRVGNTMDLYARATDAAGNFVEIKRSYVIDTWGPTVRVSQIQPDSRKPGYNPDYAFDADEPVRGYECQMDDGPWQPCTAPTQAQLEEMRKTLTPGMHFMKVRATDLIGNVSRYPGQVLVYVGGPQDNIRRGPNPLFAAVVSKLAGPKSIKPAAARAAAYRRALKACAKKTGKKRRTCRVAAEQARHPQLSFNLAAADKVSIEIVKGKKIVAELIIDGKKGENVVPLTMKLKPGSYVIEVRGGHNPPKTTKLVVK